MGEQQKEVAVYGIPQFSGTSYDIWKLRVQVYLDASKVWHTVVNDTTAKDGEAAKFKKMDAKAKSLLISLISDEYLYLREVYHEENVESS